MYSVHVTPGRSSGRKNNSDDMDSEMRAYGGRRKQSISVKLKNYIRSQFQPDAVSSESEKVWPEVTVTFFYQFFKIIYNQFSILDS